MRKEIFFTLAILSIVFIIGFVSLGGDKIVLVNRFEYQPEDITIKKGSSVHWFNVDLEGHNITTDRGRNKDNNLGLDIELSKDLDTLRLISYEFNEEGEFQYYCSLHPYMTGRIIIK
tara:strand:+ start:61156 stop:61506 length:351 start_codon:yes stop_codon:yes gene_type:complete